MCVGDRPCSAPGNSDPVYAEAYVNVHQYDILLGTIFSVLVSTEWPAHNVALTLYDVVIRFTLP